MFVRATHIHFLATIAGAAESPARRGSLKDKTMATRMTSRTVVFHRPFVLTGFERIAPAGSYVVDTEEEELDAVSSSIWRKLATVMHITHGGATEYVKIDTLDLDKALARDAAQDEGPDAMQARLDKAGRPGSARQVRRKKY
ncbi:MAG: hypothetical protein WDN03_10120 [Rhizomicrobium sp.]